MAEDTTQAVETVEDFSGTKGVALHKRWCAEIDKAEKAQSEWQKRARKIIKRYRDERPADGEQTATSRFAILWSNVETLKPAIYNRTPNPDIRRRFADRDPVARVASTIAERCVSVDMDQTDFDHAIKCARDDRLLAGRGTVWARYEAEIDKRLEVNPETGIEEEVEEVTAESAPIDHVLWSDFLHGPAKTWRHVPWVARRLRMTRGQLIKRFGKAGKDVDLEKGDDENISDKDKADGVFERGEVWEIWDKETKRVLWICKSYDKGPLDVKPDFLSLRGFFPCPRPLFASMTTDSLIPIPDYVQYQDQAHELDDVTGRISLITDAIRAAGVFAGDMPELEQLLSPRGATVQNLMIPVKNWSQFASGGGLKGAVDFLPLDTLIVTLRELYESRERIKQTIYEITGISDIVRGANKASETATASRIKGNFATLRLDEMQREVARFARDIIRIKAEIIVEQFSDETLIAMSSVDDLPEVMKEHREFERASAEYEQLLSQPPQVGEDGIPVPAEPLPLPPVPPHLVSDALALLRDEMRRSFSVDIETDSTVEPDEQVEQQSRVEMMTAVSSFMAQAIPAAQASPELAPVLGEMLLFAVRSFKSGRQLEGEIESMVDAARDAPSQPQVNPEVEKFKAEMALKQAELEQTMQLKQAEMQQEFQLKQAEMQQEMQLKQMDMEHAHKMHIAKMEQDVIVSREKLAADVQAKREQNAAVAKPTAVVQVDAAQQLGQIADSMGALAGSVAQNQAEVAQQMQAAAQALVAAAQQIARPKQARVVRDANGQITGAVQAVA